MILGVIIRMMKPDAAANRESRWQTERSRSRTGEAVIVRRWDGERDCKLSPELRRKRLEKDFYLR
jgi:hypothetical protein